MAYKKLRLLVDMGCTFIGHGLNKDFRIISMSAPPPSSAWSMYIAEARSCRPADIFVPAAQIVDTVNIYHLPHRHRKISLKFLSWIVLQQDIQSSGSHDSVEDARTALQLYEKYSQLEIEGRWDVILDDIYREGGKLGWKVPGSNDKMQVSPMMAHRAEVVGADGNNGSATLMRDDALPLAMDRLGLHGP